MSSELVMECVKGSDAKANTVKYLKCVFLTFNILLIGAKVKE